MKSNLIIIGSFLAGIFCGMFGNEDLVGYCADAPMWLLYALIIQVGLNIGANGEIGAMLQDMKVSVFFIAIIYDIGNVTFFCNGKYAVENLECV